jgi:hypothetical protein
MERTRLNGDKPDQTCREEAYLRMGERLIEELGDDADDHCLTITYYLLRAGRRADERTVLHFASRAAEIALDHASYYLAGRYFQAAARAGARMLSLDERASLLCRAGEAYRLWSDSAPSTACYREAVRLYEQSGNHAGRARALDAMSDCTHVRRQLARTALPEESKLAVDLGLRPAFADDR